MIRIERPEPTVFYVRLDPEWGRAMTGPFGATNVAKLVALDESLYARRMARVPR